MNLSQVRGFHAIVVALCWGASLVPFFVRRHRTSGTVRKEAPSSMIGLAAEVAAFALLFALHRPSPLGPFLPLPAVVELGLLAGSTVLALLAPALLASAVRALGRQWSIRARIFEGGRLAQQGAFRIVRHPVYTALLFLLVASAVAVGSPLPSLAALAVYWGGTAIRVRAEERLLAEAFGEEWAVYRGRVPGVFLGW